MISELIETVSKEAALFESFLELLEHQKEMLVTNNLDGLKEVTQRQQQKLLESRLLNKRREELTGRIKAANEIEGDLTVARLVNLVDANQAERLLQLKDLILSLNVKIGETRNSNAMLLNQSREFIARTMATLARINNPEATYAPESVARTGGNNVAVDRRA
jgi:hypothetical protein